MSIREVLRLSKSMTNEDHFGPIIVSVFEALCRSLATTAERSGVSLDSIEAFSLKNTDWQTYLLQLYENLYLADCLKVKKNSKAFASNKRGIPEGTLCYSTSIEPILDFLHERRVRLSGGTDESSNYIGNLKKSIQTSV